MAESPKRPKALIALVMLAVVGILVVFARMSSPGVPVPPQGGAKTVACAEPYCAFSAEWTVEDELRNTPGGEQGDRFLCPRCGKPGVFYTAACPKCGQTYVGRNRNMRCPHCRADSKPPP